MNRLLLLSTALVVAAGSCLGAQVPFLTLKNTTDKTIKFLYTSGKNKGGVVTLKPAGDKSGKDTVAFMGKAEEAGKLKVQLTEIKVKKVAGDESVTPSDDTSSDDAS